jgi:hypothetical protein
MQKLVFQDWNLSAASSLSSMEQLKLLEIENNNLDLSRDQRIWRKEGTPQGCQMVCFQTKNTSFG